jgi:hypothetical protein
VTDIGFSKYGKSFQENLVHLIFEDRTFSDQIREVFDSEFLELKYLRIFVEYVFSYRDRYGIHPSLDTMTTLLRTDLDKHNEVAQKQVRDYFVRITSGSAVGDADFIKEVSLDFCRKQKLKTALIESAELINDASAGASYEDVKRKIDTALKLGTDNNFGYDYLVDFEKRFEIKARNPVTTGWSVIDRIISGGLGAGELGVVVAPTGVGKSMALVHLGAEAVKAGKTVVHYTLELSDTVVASRYDSCISGIDLRDLFHRKDEIFEIVKEIPGKLIVKEYPTKLATTQTLKNHLERLVLLDNKPDMIIVDYGDLLSPIKFQREKRTDLESIYEEMRGLAQIYDCPVWTASQTNRTGINADVITMESISEAFNKCFVADFIFSISRTVEDKEEDGGRVFIAKNRNGPDGIVFPIHMQTKNVSIKVLSSRGESPASVVENNVKKQKESLQKKYIKHLKNQKE